MRGGHETRRYFASFDKQTLRNPTSPARLANMFKEETNSTSQRPGIGMSVNYDPFHMDRNLLEARS